MSAPLTDCCEFMRPPSALAAFQGHFLSTFAAYNSRSKKDHARLLTGNQHLGILPGSHGRDSAAWQRTCSFQFSCLFSTSGHSCFLSIKTFRRCGNNVV